MSTEISNKYWLRFGQISLELGFINETQLNDALRIQRGEAHCEHGPRSLATILFDNEWMASEQIDNVLNAVLKKMRQDEPDLGDPHRASA